jgi:hypothetical protein
MPGRQINEVGEKKAAWTGILKLCMVIEVEKYAAPN